MARMEFPLLMVGIVIARTITKESTVDSVTSRIVSEMREYLVLMDTLFVAAIS
jgi:hypothetical protein